METRDLRLSLEQLNTIYNNLISTKNYKKNETLQEIAEMIQITITQSNPETLNDFTA